MRVAVLGQYPLDPMHLGGGVEAAIVYAQRELVKLPDLDLHYITCHPAIDSPRLTMLEGAPVTLLPRGRWGRITWHVAEVWALGRVLREIRPDLVHAHGTGLYAGAALASGLPSVITAHGIVAEEARLLTDRRARQRAMLDTWYERWVMRRARQLIVISPYVERVFAGRYQAHTYLVENPCDERFFGVVRNPKPGRILFVGSVIQRKGVQPLIRAFQRLHQQLPTAELHIAGALGVEPTYARGCQELARTLLPRSSDAVRFLGALTADELMQAYATCAVTVLPSFQETAPVAIEEAMAAGAPVVATQVGGIPWMLADGETGRVLPKPLTAAGDPERLSDVLLQLLRDPNAEKMGQCARVVAQERFRASVVAQRTLAVYREILGDAPNNRARCQATRAEPA